MQQEAPSLYDPRDFGATLDGSTDDASAVNAAIDAAGEAGGGVVPIPDTTLIGSSLELRTRVWLRGMGEGVQLRAGSSLSGPMLRLSDGQQFGIRVSHLRLNGRSNLTSGVSGIEFLNDDNAGFQLQPRQWLSDILAYDMSGPGVVLGGSPSASFLSEIHVEQCQGPEYEIRGTDNLLLGCVAGTSHVEGFWIRGPNNRLVGCKGFGSGNARGGSPDRGRGFRIESDRNVLSGCEAQDCSDAGYLFHACRDLVGSALLSDSNRNTNFRWDDCHDSLFDGLQAHSRPGGTFDSSIGLEHYGNCRGNRIRAMARGNETAFSGDASRSDIEVNGRTLDRVNRERLSGSISLGADARRVQSLHPGDATRTVRLPSPRNGLEFLIANRANPTEDATVRDLTVRDADGTLLATIHETDAGRFICDGTGWTTLMGASVARQT